MPADCDVSILILAHNKVAYSQRCLEALLLSSLRPLQVVLVNNGSSDQTQACFEAFAARAAQTRIACSLLHLDKNVGAICGRNQGMALLRGRYWVFLDNDVVVRTRSWLERLRHSLQADERVGVVGPKLVYPTTPYLIQCAGCQVTTGGQVLFRGRGCARDDALFATACNCQSLISASWMMPAAVARQVGAMDEQFSPVQFEDIDYCYRIREAGYCCRYEPGVELYHFENVTSGRTAAINYPYLTVKNGLKFKAKWQHRFSSEGGPTDQEWSWAAIPSVGLEEMPPMLETIP